ncbi:MAG: calcium-binding protein [Cyanobacteria bacterium J06636_16]
MSVIQGTEAVDNLVGTSENDSISGGDGVDTLFGEAGDDTLSGDNGADKLFGGTGNDSISGGDGVDTLFGGTGNDTLTGDDGVDFFVMLPGEGSDVVTDFQSESFDQIGLAGGLTFADVTIVQAGANTVVNADGTQFTLTGFQAANLTELNFTLLGSDEDDVLVGGDQTSCIDGADGNDTLLGGEGNDILRGDDGNDTLVGENGNDTLIGGAGADTLTGGLGSDSFVLDSPSDTSSLTVDTVTDFNSAEGDKIDAIDLEFLGIGITYEQVRSDVNINASGQTFAIVQNAQVADVEANTLFTEPLPQPSI